MTMVRTNIATGIGLLMALVLMAGLAAAQAPLALVTGEGGGEASGEAQGSYYADASGATNTAHATHTNTINQAQHHYDQTTNAYDQTKTQTWNHINNTHPPQTPNTPDNQLLNQLDQANHIQATHTDQLQKTANIQTDYANAGADLSASGHVKAFLHDAFQGIADAVTGLKDKLTIDTSATDDAKTTTKTLLDADQQARAEIDSLVHQDHQLPQANPTLNGDATANHATQVASSAAGQGIVQAP